MRKLLFILLTLTSCAGLAPNRMFKTPRDYAFAVDSTNSKPYSYHIQVGDRLELHIFSNNGFKLVDLTDYNPNGVGGTNGTEMLTYLVESDSLVKLPVLGNLNLVGLTMKEAEKKLEVLYAKYYNDPFIVLKVTNRHVYVFLSDGGKGVLVPLTNDNTTLFEVLAQAGGMSELGKVNSIKILRGDPNNPSVYKADLSTVSGLKDSELKIYSNDIIYVDGTSKLSKRVTSDVVPFLSLFGTLIVIAAYLKL
jgi:polysaccharide export outer membrane protein